MLVDARIRQDLMLLADTVAVDGVDAALGDVVRCASVRSRRERVGVGLASAVAVLVLIVAFWSGGGSTRLDPIERDEPARRPATPVERQTEARTRRATTFEGPPRRGSVASPRKGSLSAPRDQTERQARTKRDVSSSAVPAKEQDSDQALNDLGTRRDSAEYEPAIVSPRPFSRSGCSYDGRSCMSFRTHIGDQSAQVSVYDRLGVPVPVRVTQWNRHGATVTAPLLFCGGSSDTFDLAPSVVNVTVSVEEGSCDGGPKVSPEGGRIDILFRGER